MEQKYQTPLKYHLPAFKLNTTVEKIPISAVLVIPAPHTHWKAFLVEHNG